MVESCPPLVAPVVTWGHLFQPKHVNYKIPLDGRKQLSSDPHRIIAITNGENAASVAFQSHQRKIEVTPKVGC